MTPSAADLAVLPDETDAATNGEPEPTIEGANGQLSLKVGGHKVTASEFKLGGGSIAVEGEFEKGARVRLEIEAVVGEVHFVDTTDHVGTVTGTTRRHVARIDSLRRIPAPSAA